MIVTVDLPGTENYYPDVRRTGSYVKVIRMLVEEITTTPLKKTMWVGLGLYLTPRKMLIF